MEPITIGMAALSLYGAASSYFAGQDAAAAKRKETAEMARRLMRRNNETLSTATALGAASGITSDSKSLTAYLTDMSAEFRRQADWMKQAGEAGASAIELQSQYGAASNLGSSIFQFGAANNWFKTPTK